MYTVMISEHVGEDNVVVDCELLTRILNISPKTLSGNADRAEVLKTYISLCKVLTQNQKEAFDYLLQVSFTHGLHTLYRGWQSEL